MVSPELSPLPFKNVYAIIDEWIETAKYLGREIPSLKGRLAYA